MVETRASVRLSLILRHGQTYLTKVGARARARQAVACDNPNVDPKAELDGEAFLMKMAVSLNCTNNGYSVSV